MRNEDERETKLTNPDSHRDRQPLHRDGIRDKHLLLHPCTHHIRPRRPRSCRLALISAWTQRRRRPLVLLLRNPVLPKILFPLLFTSLQLPRRWGKRCEPCWESVDGGRIRTCDSVYPEASRSRFLCRSPGRKSILPAWCSCCPSGTVSVPSLRRRRPLESSSPGLNLRRGLRSEARTNDPLCAVPPAPCGRLQRLPR